MFVLGTLYHRKPDSEEGLVAKVPSFGTSARPASVTISGIEHAAALLLLFAPSSSCPQHKPCPRLTLTPSLPPLPTFNPSSMPLWSFMRRRRKQSFSITRLPPSYRPVTPPPLSYLSSRILSSSLIAVAAAMRDYRVGLVQQSAFSTRSPLLSVKGLVSLVSIDNLPTVI